MPSNATTPEEAPSGLPCCWHTRSSNSIRHDGYQDSCCYCGREVVIQTRKVPAPSHGPLAPEIMKWDTSQRPTDPCPKRPAPPEPEPEPLAPGYLLGAKVGDHFRWEHDGAICRIRRFGAGDDLNVFFVYVTGEHQNSQGHTTLPQAVTLCNAPVRARAMGDMRGVNPAQEFRDIVNSRPNGAKQGKRRSLPQALMGAWRGWLRGWRAHRG